MLSQPIPRQNPEPILSLKQKMSHSLTGYGFQEIISYSLTGLEMLNKLLPESRPPELTLLRIANPMTAEQEYLRPNLRANLVAALSTNRRHEEGGVRRFELGKVYVPRQKDLPDEPDMLCGILSGPRWEKSGHGGDNLFDFYDAKGIVEGLLCQLGGEASFAESQDKSLHPVKQAAIMAGDSRLGVVGELHSRASQTFDIAEPVYLFEIEMTALLPFTTGYKKFQPIPRFPSIVRDVALIVDIGLTHQGITDIIKSFALVNNVDIFDVYTGEQVPPGKKSLAYSITFQSPNHTLTDQEVNRVQQQILKRLSHELGASLRT